TIGVIAPGGLDFGDARLGAKTISLALPSINIGSEVSLAAAATDGVLPVGWSLTQARLNALIDGDAGNGIPGLESLVLTATNSINFVGSVSIDTTDDVGAARASLTLQTPALYGLGNADDVAVLRTDRLVWNGVLRNEGGTPPRSSSAPPGAILPFGPG